MPITTPETVITGLDEQLIRDNLDNPDAQLLAKALECLMAPYRSATLDRARRAYTEASAADPTATLPNWTDEEGMINWYVGGRAYRNATARAAVARLAHIGNELGSLQSDKTRYSARLKQLAGSSNIEFIATVRATIDSLDGQIAALTAEQSELEALTGEA